MSGEQSPRHGDVLGHVEHALKLSKQIRAANAHSEEMRQELRWTLFCLRRFLEYLNGPEQPPRR